METPLERYLAARRALPAPEVRRAIRTGAGVSRAFLAAQFTPPVSRFTVGAWERGTRRPNARHVTQYVELLRALAAA